MGLQCEVLLKLDAYGEMMSPWVYPVLSRKRQTTIERIKGDLVELLELIQSKDVEPYTQLG